MCNLIQFSLKYIHQSSPCLDNKDFISLELPKLKCEGSYNELTSILPSINDLFQDILPAKVNYNSNTLSCSPIRSNVRESIICSPWSFNHYPSPRYSGMRIKKSIYQVDILEKTFDITPFPNRLLRTKLAKTLNLKTRTVQIWFQNRRQRSRRNSSISYN